MNNNRSKISKKLKLYFVGFILATFVLAALAFVSSRVCHSSVISLAGLFHFSQLVYFTTKYFLLVKKRRRDNECGGDRAKKDSPSSASRLGVFVDLLCSTFINALCVSIVIRSIEHLFGHEELHEDADKEEEDQLHHDHENFKQYHKIMLMTFVGMLLLVCDLVLLVVYFNETVLKRKSKKRNEYTPTQPPTSINEQSAFDKISFKPFADCKIRKENYYLIVPSDLVKMSRKILFTMVYLSGPLAIIINSIVYRINYENDLKRNLNNQTATTPTITTVLAQETINPNEHLAHYHDHDHDMHSSLFSGGFFHTCLNFLLINIDPILSVALSIFYLVFFLKIFKLAALILSQAVPLSVNVARVQSDLLKLIPAIKNIHEFYLFEWTPFNLCISMHFVIEKNAQLSNGENQLVAANTAEQIRDYFAATYMIHSLTIQPEFMSNECNDQCQIKSKYKIQY